MTGSKARRGAMWVLASGVAAIAAIQSYSHIYDLGRAHGGSGVAGRLLPLSVDMLILVGELMLLHEADAKGNRFVLGWVLVWSGILATLAANVTYGYQFGILGALIWGWPAYSFILAAAGMVAVVKRGATGDATPDTAEGLDVPGVAVSVRGYADALMPVKTAVYRFFAEDDTLLYIGMTAYLKDRFRDHKRLKPWWPEVARTDIQWYPDRMEAAQAEAAAIVSEQPRYNIRTALDSSVSPGFPAPSVRRSDKVRDILKESPTLPKANVAELAGVSARTVERVKRELNGAAK
jgi:hypothetical protein